jgi:hypothetical protein
MKLGGSLGNVSKKLVIKALVHFQEYDFALENGLTVQNILSLYDKIFFQFSWNVTK